MDLDAFDFDLPEDRIALRPVRPRDAARLLVVRGAAGGLARAAAQVIAGFASAPRENTELEDSIVRDLPALLRPGDILVANDSRVIPAALSGVRPARETGRVDVAVEANLNRRLSPSLWTAFVRPGRRIKAGDVLAFRGLTARVAAIGAGGEVELAFDRDGLALDAALATAGSMPLPPYIASRRSPDAADQTDYQTIYGAADGSVAAPTAGLHFTPELMAALDRRGIGWATVTLHVNAGTFLPVKSRRLEDHHMHREQISISKATAQRVNAVRAAGGRVIAVGTTALRALETAGRPEGLVAFEGETGIFLRPGSTFHVVDGLITNFHLPRSTLFVLVCALMGTANMQAAYAHAVASGYRFYSYGDASLLLP